MATDYYSQVEAAAMAKLRTLSALFPKPEQVSTNIDDLQRGLKYFAHFMPSTFQTARVDGREKAIIWTVLFDLYVRYTTQKESIGLFKGARAEIFYLYNSDPMLGGAPNVSNVSINAVSEVLQDLPGDNPNFVIQTFGLAVSQRIRFGF